SLLALALAEHRPIEIISVDSTQVYRGFDIGAAKPSAAQRARVPHHLIDCCDPTDIYDAGRFVRDAVRLAGEIAARGRLPLLVGGTMMYFRALLRGLATLPAADPQLRAQIEARAAARGWRALHAELAAVDPHAAARIAPGDPQRIQRALEVYYASGRPISEWQRDTTTPAPLTVVARWALMPRDRARLHQRIAARLHTMMEQGLLDEVRRLRARGDLHAGLPALRSVGYRQLWALLDATPQPDSAQLAAAVDAAIIATRQLARRQLTWINADPGWCRIEADDPSELASLAARLADALPTAPSHAKILQK
ncbi:MAG: tRNA (adenosine(37)-N6)-dimethylallyltransferase MiaA, partial [Steroidobacteraceae bacterium]|nr:tRNA (adenosine(37)-N6)-dimethylallyltransferase MiaA [Steroidobacteraceae bacterium]